MVDLPDGVESSFGICLLVLIEYMNVTDNQTDRWKDRNMTA